MGGASDERRAPSAIGTLATRPLVHLLVYARNRRLTGLLELHAPDGCSGTLSLWRGRIHDVRTQPAVAYFGAVAHELGHIDTPTLDTTLLEISTSKRLHGEVLVERGSLTPELRDQILAEQACRKIHHLFSLPTDASFAFYESTRSTNEPSFSLDPIKPTWLGLRVHPPTDSVREVLSRYATATFRLVNEGPLAAAGLDRDEAALCEALTRKPMNVAQMRATSALPAMRVELLVYLLVITKCAEPAAPSTQALPALPATQPAMPAVRPSSSSMPAAARSDTVELRHSLSFRVPSTQAFKVAGGSSPRIPAQAAPIFSPADLGAIGIAHRARIIAKEDPFAVLGLPRGATVEAARAAYFRLSKLWHPDRLPADLASFRVEVAKIFDYMTHAHATLIDPDARRDLLVGKSPTLPAATRPRNELIREIEQALAGREFGIAEDMSRQLMSVDPDDAQAQALAAWASTSGGEAPEETLRTALTALDRAVHLDFYCECAHFYRGSLHKRLGSNAAAFRDFARVVQLNPKHIDAQREVRIFEMRARTGSGEHALDVAVAKKNKKK